MSHQCIKTGCLAYLHDYGEWVYDDAHLVGNVLVIRVADLSFAPPEGMNKHFTIAEVDYWPDRDSTRTEYPMLMATQWENHGYDGLPTS